jgi:transposase
MAHYVGLDVSQKETEICVIDGEGHRVWRGKCLSRPGHIAEAVRQHALDLAKVGMETGPLSIWLWHGLRALGVPVDCIHARHVAAALSLQVNKTDANDAHGIAQVVRSGRACRATASGLYCRPAASLSRCEPASATRSAAC